MKLIIFIFIFLSFSCILLQVMLHHKYPTLLSIGKAHCKTAKKCYLHAHLNCLYITWDTRVIIYKLETIIAVKFHYHWIIIYSLWFLLSRTSKEYLLIWILSHTIEHWNPFNHAFSAMAFLPNCNTAVKCKYQILKNGEKNLLGGTEGHSEYNFAQQILWNIVCYVNKSCF